MLHKLSTLPGLLKKEINKTKIHSKHSWYKSHFLLFKKKPQKLTLEAGFLEEDKPIKDSN
jgi:hypothetical protein